jgi:ubiquitin-protein ligase
VRAETGALAEAPFHFWLDFEESYPASPPQLLLHSPVPHPMLVRRVNTAAGEPQFRLRLWDCVHGKDTWCFAYTVQSVLVQLQAFLPDEDMHYDTRSVRLSSPFIPLPVHRHQLLL